MTVCERPSVIRSVTTLGCYGVSPVTDKPVGSRHSWDWLNRCRFCHRSKEQVRIVEFKSVSAAGGAV